MTNQNAMCGIFGFPTGKVLEAATGGQEIGITRKMVNDIYDSYKKAILVNEFPPYQWKDSKGIIHWEVKYFIMQDTGLGEFEVGSVLKAIHDLAQSGVIQNQYWNIEKQTEKPLIPGLPQLPDFEKISKNLKWVGIAALIAVGLYFTWPLLRQVRRKIK